MFRIVLLIVYAFFLSACTSEPPAPDTAVQDDLQVLENRLDRTIPDLLAEEKVAGVGIAVIRNGELVWQAYYGEQSAGVPVTQATVFNTASVAKTITAETLIALSAKGIIDFDEPIAPYVSHPDLVEDPRYQQLTARLLLSHRAGLLNWAYAYEDGRLAFDHDPATRFSYSGAGIELAADYAEAKTGKTFRMLASEHVLEPLGIKEISLGRIPDWAEGRIASPMDNEGNYRSIAELNASLAGGQASGAADDLLVTVPAYAKLIVALLKSDWLTQEQIDERERIITSLEGDPIYQCPDLDWLVCPTLYGYGLGWQVYQYDNHKVLKHSGSDAGENAIVYYSPDRQSGGVIFVNGANGWVVMARILEIIGDEPLIADYYRGLIEALTGRALLPLEQ